LYRDLSSGGGTVGSGGDKLCGGEGCPVAKGHGARLPVSSAFSVTSKNRLSSADIVR
jgi:hypothetical protein